MPMLKISLEKILPPNFSHNDTVSKWLELQKNNAISKYKYKKM